MQTNVTLEEALQRASRPLQKKIMHSVELLRKAEKIALSYDKTDGFYLAFSGGKDSQALLHIAQIGGGEIQTSHEPHERGPTRSYSFREAKLPRSGIDKAKGFYL